MKFCPKCRALIMQGTTYCADCQAEIDKTKAARKAISNAKAGKKYNKYNRNPAYVSFYRSNSWKTLRAVKLSQAGYLCEDCKAGGLITVATDVHHIQPISEAWDKRLDIANLKCLCVVHHNMAHSRWGASSKPLKAKLTLNKDIKITYED